jgi:hypothetical protein
MKTITITTITATTIMVTVATADRAWCAGKKWTKRITSASAVAARTIVVAAKTNGKMRSSAR